jgi:hypothetical protein
MVVDVVHRSKQGLPQSGDGLGRYPAAQRLPQGSARYVMRWVSGEEKPTTKAFLDVVDLLTEADPIAFARKRSVSKGGSKRS